MEGQLLRSYEACCFKKLNKETNRLLTTKILHFDNVWFILHTTSWVWLVMENISDYDDDTLTEYVEDKASRHVRLQMGEQSA